MKKCESCGKKGKDVLLYGWELGKKEWTCQECYSMFYIALSISIGASENGCQSRVLR